MRTGAPRLTQPCAGQPTGVRPPVVGAPGGAPAFVVSAPRS
ncbi:hypothetical protein Q760_07280 [Cellulomonas cellasea DSM 20118]|uniref:Uncharacterized protein n=1 Tax=Cellulomonas cellasea DSM 20118 TaxID=1408250 RepID=A0A0A0B367_9CELL|nr:hypothetical protein Q760_07280 [Cellulomonas cellasea DSM 20118]